MFLSPQVTEVMLDPLDPQGPVDQQGPQGQQDHKDRQGKREQEDLMGPQVVIFISFQISTEA